MTTRFRNINRRDFLGAAGAATLGLAMQPIEAFAAPVSRPPNELPLIPSSTTAGAAPPLAPVKQIDAGVVNVGYVDAGPPQGPPVLLLRGWPYDIQSFAEVTPILTAKGYRCVVPYIRGYGTTRFLSSGAVRSGQPSAVALDTVALMDALKIEKAILAGFDWGLSRPPFGVGAAWACAPCMRVPTPVTAPSVPQ